MKPVARTALVILNPAARRASKFDPDGALRRLDRWGITAELIIPRSAEESVDIARRAAADGVDLLLVAGGDGSLRLAAGAIANSSTVLAPIPIGTANVWAREIGIPGRWDEAIDTHVLGQRLRMDLATADGQPFLLMAGIGWDAAIADRVQPGLKRVLGPGAYVVEAARALPGLASQTVDMRIDGQALIGNWGMVVLGNTRLYGGVVEFTPDAVADDGLLDIIALGPRQRGEGTVLAFRLVTNSLQQSPATHLARAGSVTVATAGLPVQLDGDVVGETPMRFTVQQHALLVSVPAGPIPPLFRQNGNASNS